MGTLAVEVDIPMVGFLPTTSTTTTRRGQLSVQTFSPSSALVRETKSSPLAHGTSVNYVVTPAPTFVELNIEIVMSWNCLHTSYFQRFILLTDWSMVVQNGESKLMWNFAFPLPML